MSYEWVAGKVVHPDPGSLWKHKEQTRLCQARIRKDRDGNYTQEIRLAGIYTQSMLCYVCSQGQSRMEP